MIKPVMNAYISDDLPFEELTDSYIRLHPWPDNKRDPDDKYYDFKANPALISEVLNNFKGWSDWSEWEGVRLFYRLLEWLNGPDSRLESNGCGFRGPRRNPQKVRLPGEFMTDGGLIFLFRDTELNLSEQSAAWATMPKSIGATVPRLAPGKNINWLVRRSQEHLQQLNPEFIWGRVSIVLFPTLFTELPLEDNDRYGHEVCFQWWAWGDTQEETMAHFKEVVVTMFDCLKRVSAEAKTATYSVHV
jgi:hypothetical protein